MPRKSGKSSDRGEAAKSNNSVETDPLVHTASPELKQPAEPRRPRRGKASAATTLDEPTPHDPNPPGFASEVELNVGGLPAAARAPKAPAEDAWSGFDEGATGDAWGVSSGSVVEDSPHDTGLHDGPPLAGRDRARPAALDPRGNSALDSGLDSNDAFMAAPLDNLPAVKLVAVSGAEAGREFVVRHREMGVGRGAENDVILADPSVSREHARLVFEAGQFALEDLNSGNGTFVNGQKISRQRLQHGDEIAFGNAAFRFLEGDAVPLLPGARGDPADALAGRPRRTGRISRGWRLAATVTGGLAVAVILVGTFYLRRYGGFTGSEARRDLMFSHYERGVEAFKGHHWDQAEEQFVVALGLDPQNPRTRRYVKAIGRERLAEAQLSEARVARKRGDLARANGLALGILDSSCRADAQALLRDIDAECEGRVSRGQQLLTSGQTQEAMQMLQSVDVVRPGRPDVAELLVRANLKVATAQVMPATLANRATRRRSLAFTGPLAEAHREFINGDVEPALQTLDSLNSEEAAAMRDKIEKFREAYQGGMNEHKLKHAGVAIRMLGEAKTLEAQISGGSSKLLSDIDQKLADMFYLQGMQSLSSNDLPQAYQSLRSTINLVPSHMQAMQKLAELAQKAQQMFDAAGREADVQKARAALQGVLQIVATDSELYRKAKQRLDALP